jgi:hypothetical protein
MKPISLQQLVGNPINHPGINIATRSFHQVAGKAISGGSVIVLSRAGLLQPIVANDIP